MEMMPPEEQLCNVRIDPSVISKIDSILCSIRYDATAKGDNDLLNWGKHVGEDFDFAIVRLYQGEKGHYPASYPRLAKVGYRRLAVAEYWGLFYLIDGNTIDVHFCIDSRENPNKYKPVSKRFTIIKATKP